VSNRKRAIGGPTMKAKPRERLFIPRHLINLSGSKTSEMATHVSVLKAPEKNHIQKEQELKAHMPLVTRQEVLKAKSHEL